MLGESVRNFLVTTAIVFACLLALDGIRDSQPVAADPAPTWHRVAQDPCEGHPWNHHLAWGERYQQPIVMCDNGDIMVLAR